MNILLVGGGTAGSVSPLLAVAEEIKLNYPKANFLLVGTKTGPEKTMAESAGLDFVSIPAGKLRRYFSLRNFLVPFLVLAGFFKALKILKKFRPDCVFGAGSFVQVPVVWAAALKKIPVALHQQDVRPSLANNLCQIPAKKITVSFEASLTDFSSGFGLFYKKHRTEKVVLTGNPFRAEIKQATRQEALKKFGLKNDLPALLVLGGGTGAEFLNNLIASSLPQLARTVQILHSTGKNKTAANAAENYHPYEFIVDMGSAYAAADIVLCRAGLSTITELSNLEKVSIIVPLPQSHQELNAALLARRRAAIVATQNRLTPELLVELVRKLLFEHQFQQNLKTNIGKIMPKNAAKKIAEIITKLAEQ